ncbi:MBL fold metallo-hydrolase, partial [Vibrio sp. PP-XX7]
MLHVQSFFDSETHTATHVAYCSETKECAIIDPVLDLDTLSWKTQTHSAQQVIEYVQNQQLRVRWILETHVHADHLTAAPFIKEKLGGHIGIGNQITQVQKVFKAVFNSEAEFLLMVSNLIGSSLMENLSNWV